MSRGLTGEQVDELTDLLTKVNAASWAGETGDMTQVRLCLDAVADFIDICCLPELAGGDADV